MLLKHLFPKMDNVLFVTIFFGTNDSTPEGNLIKHIDIKEYEENMNKIILYF